jgi:hypothetical protein
VLSTFCVRRWLHTLYSCDAEKHQTFSWYKNNKAPTTRICLILSFNFERLVCGHYHQEEDKGDNFMAPRITCKFCPLPIVTRFLYLQNVTGSIKTI